MPKISTDEGETFLLREKEWVGQKERIHALFVSGRHLTGPLSGPLGAAGDTVAAQQISNEELDLKAFRPAEGPTTGTLPGHYKGGILWHAHDKL